MTRAGALREHEEKKGGPFFLQALHDSGCAQRFHLLCIGMFEETTLHWLEEHRRPAVGD
jgi:hypothetical protein